MFLLEHEELSESSVIVCSSMIKYVATDPTICNQIQPPSISINQFLIKQQFVYTGNKIHSNIE